MSRPAKYRVRPGFSIAGHPAWHVERRFLGLFWRGDDYYFSREDAEKAVSKAARGAREQQESNARHLEAPTLYYDADGYRTPGP